MSDEQLQLQEQWTVLWWALSLGLFALWGAWKKGFFQPLRPQSGDLPFIRGKDVLRGFAYFLIFQLVFIPFFTAFLLGINALLTHQPFQLDLYTKGWIYLFMILGGLGGVLIAYFQIPLFQRKRLWQQTSAPWYRQMGIGIAAWCFAFPLVLALNQFISLLLWHFFHSPFTEQSAIENLRKVQEHPLVFNLIGLSIFTLVPLTEEILFRGFLQQWLKQKFGHFLPAILLSSLIFALFHYSQKQGSGNIGLLTSLFFLACLLGYLYERQRSLWPCVALHGCFNFITLLFLVSK